MESIEENFENILVKFTGLKGNTDDFISNAISTFVEISKSFNNGEPTVSEAQSVFLKEGLKKFNEELQKISTEHGKLQNSVTTIGENIEKNFVSNYDKITTPGFLEDEKSKQILNKIVAKYYYTRGCEDVALSLIEEAKLSDEAFVEILEHGDSAQMYIALEAIKQHNLKPAFEWVEKYSNQLTIMKSDLEFKLHALEFSKILVKGTSAQLEAIVYARTHFTKYSGQYETEIQHLMGSLIYLPGGLENSPYKNLISPDIWLEVTCIFLKDACNVLGVNKNMHFPIVVEAGCSAIPPLITVQQLFQFDLTSKGELPIDISMSHEFQYHSIFVCPILQQKTDNQNPPMRLNCGHVISHTALCKLGRGQTVRCPFCCIKQKRHKAKRIYFK